MLWIFCVALALWFAWFIYLFIYFFGEFVYYVFGFCVFV